MTDTNLGNVGGDVALNQGRDMLQAGEDVVGRDKTINIINNYQKTTKQQIVKQRIPELLSYLLNREEQENDLIEAIEKYEGSKKPLICIIYGNQDDCCSDKFTERIKHYILPKIPSYSNQIPDIAQIKTGLSKNETQLHNNMKGSLGEKITGFKSKKISFAEIGKKFVENKSSLVTYSCLSDTDYFEFAKKDLFNSFLKFWQHWEAKPQQNHLILVCLFVYLKPYKPNFFSRILRKKDPNIQVKKAIDKLDFKQFEVNGVILPRVDCISQKHIEEWAGSPPVYKYFNRSIYQELKSEINHIYENHENGKLSLSEMGQELEILLQPFAPEKII